jgi:hypothetical protein
MIGMKKIIWLLLSVLLIGGSIALATAPGNQMEPHTCSEQPPMPTP